MAPGHKFDSRSESGADAEVRVKKKGQSELSYELRRRNEFTLNRFKQ